MVLALTIAAVILFLAWSYFLSITSYEEKVRAKLRDAAKTHQIDYGWSLETLITKLSVKYFNEFLEESLHFSSIQDAPIEVQVALVDAWTLRTTALCCTLSLNHYLVAKKVSEGLYGVNKDSAVIAGQSIASFTKSLTKKNMQHFRDADAETKSFVINHTLALLATPIEQVKPGTEASIAVRVLNMHIDVYTESFSPRN